MYLLEYANVLTSYQNVPRDIDRPSNSLPRIAYMVSESTVSDSCILQSYQHGEVTTEWPAFFRKFHLRFRE